MSDYLFAATRKKLSLLEQLFHCDSIFSELACCMIDEEDVSLCRFLDSWIDEKIVEGYQKYGFNWDDCQRMRYADMSDDEIVAYANELGISIDQDALDELFIVN